MRHSIFKIFFVATALVFSMSSFSKIAQSYAGIKDQGIYVYIKIDTAYSAYTLVGEPVKICTAKWSIKDITYKDINIILAISLEVF